MDKQSSIAISAYRKLSIGDEISVMKTIAEIRRERLEELIALHGGLANLNEKLGRPRNDSKLSQLRNANIRKDRGKPIQMGDAAARHMETVLGLEVGWMDNAANPYSADRRIDHAMKLFATMEDWQRDQAIKVLDALAQPPKSNGTDGQ